jgi:acylphosphatase
VITENEVPMEQKTIRAQVFGIVQGVCFREYTRRKAEELGCDGWVKNRSDGSVETLISGPPETIAEMTDWLHHGPPHAHVERVEVESVTEPSVPPSSPFQILF